MLLHEMSEPSERIREFSYEIITEIHDALKVAVTRGAQLLDKKIPGWTDHQYIGDLDIQYDYSDPLAILYGDFKIGAGIVLCEITDNDYLRPNDANHGLSQAIDHGFCSTTSLSKIGYTRRMNELWRDQILLRQKQSAIHS